MTQEISQLRRTLGAHDRAKLGEYFDAVRDVEQRIAKAESTNSDFAVPEQPVGVPDDVQGIRRADVRSAGAGVPGGHHARQHVHDGARKHQSLVSARSACPRRITRCRTTATTRKRWRSYAKLNTYHVETLAYFLKKLESIQDGDGTLLDHTVVLYGSGMSDGNVHNNYNVPVMVVGGRDQQIKGNRHLDYPKGTPLANLLLTSDGQVRRARWRSSATAPASSTS